jgi:uncharacterized glyoxalase superfamily protein PhnB
MKLTGVTPNLVTNDIPRAVAFYRDVLGFNVMTTVPEAEPFVFVLLERDGVNVFLNDLKTVLHDTPDATSLVVGQSGVAMFFLIDDATAMWEQVRHRAPVVMALKDQWYGMREFTVTDPDGYVVTFAERIAT